MAVTVGRLGRGASHRRRYEPSREDNARLGHPATQDGRGQPFGRVLGVASRPLGRLEAPQASTDGQLVANAGFTKPSPNIVSVSVRTDV